MITKYSISSLPRSKFILRASFSGNFSCSQLFFSNAKIPIFEINHGTKFKLNSILSVKPFLSGPILTDSAVLIQIDNDIVLNLNDSKPQSFMMKEIVSSIGKNNLKVMLYF